MRGNYSNRSDDRLCCCCRCRCRCRFSSLSNDADWTIAAGDEDERTFSSPSPPFSFVVVIAAAEHEGGGGGEEKERFDPRVQQRRSAHAIVQSLQQFSASAQLPTTPSPRRDATPYHCGDVIPNTFYTYFPPPRSSLLHAVLARPPFLFFEASFQTTES